MFDKLFHNNQKINLFLIGLFIAAESYFLQIALSWFFSRNFLITSIIHFLSIIGPMFILLLIATKARGSKRQKVILAAVILLFSAIAALAYVAARIYFLKKAV